MTLAPERVQFVVFDPSTFIIKRVGTTPLQGALANAGWGENIRFCPLDSVNVFTATDGVKKVTDLTGVEWIVLTEE